MNSMVVPPGTVNFFFPVLRTSPFTPKLQCPSSSSVFRHRYFGPSLMRALCTLRGICQMSSASSTFCACSPSLPRSFGNPSPARCLRLSSALHAFCALACLRANFHSFLWVSSLCRTSRMNVRTVSSFWGRWMLLTDTLSRSFWDSCFCSVYFPDSTLLHPQFQSYTLPYPTEQLSKSTRSPIRSAFSSTHSTYRLAP